MSNPYTDRKNTNDKGASGRSSERRTAKRAGGRMRPGSGSLDGAKGDFTVGPLLVEAKSTINASMQLQLTWLSKIMAEAERENMIPALSIAFCTGNGTPRKDGAWVMIPERVFNRMVAADVFEIPGEEL